MTKLIFTVIFSVLLSSACQTIQLSKRQSEIFERSTLWNEAFKHRDIEGLLKLYSEDAQMATAGAKLKMLADCQRLFASLFKNRSDIEWVNTPTQITVNDAWEVALEEGDWLEKWTEPDGQAAIRGKYTIMWKQKNGPWLIHAMIFTPLSCTGESQYCKPHEK